MNLENVKYDAFISYRHKDLDQFVAVTLHKELEAFRLPKKLQKTLAKNGMTKKKIERVFRDRDELPITNNLADPIMNALSNSEYLLVICTPRLPESIWCKTEVENFIKMHGRERVFAVLAEGEPAESFPEALLYEEREVEDENGNKVMQKVPVEPLAADVRGASKKEIRKKIKEEVLRLAAPMFDCSYDDLKQRHREQKIKRIITASLSATAVFGAFAVVSTTMALQIHKQSGQIKEQAAKIEEQYTEALKVNAKNMAKDALELADYGDKKGAAELAYSALKGTEEEPMPYTADAEYALSEALMVYKAGTKMLPVQILELDAELSTMVTSPNSSRIIAADILGNIKVYDPEMDCVLADIPAQEDNFYMSDRDLCFLSENVIVYPDEKGVAVHNIETDEAQIIELKGVYNLTASNDGKYFVCRHFEGTSIFDGESLKELYFLSKDVCNTGVYAYVSSEEKYAAISYDEDDNAGVILIDFANNNMYKYQAKYDGVCSIYIYGENIYVASYGGDGVEVFGEIACIDKMGNQKWSYETACIVDRMQTFGAGERDKLAYIGYGILGTLSIADGSLVSEASVGTEDVIEMACYKDSNNVAFMARDGVLHYLNTDQNTDYIMDDKVETNSDNLKAFCFGNGFFASNTYNDAGVAIYKYMKGKNVEEIADFNEIGSICGFAADKTGDFFALQFMSDDFNTIRIADAKEGTIISTITCEKIIDDFTFTDDGEIVILSSDSINIADCQSGNIIDVIEIENEGDLFTYIAEGFFINDGKYVAACSNNGICVIDSSDGKIENQFGVEDLQISGKYVFDVKEDGTAYAYADQNQETIVIGRFDSDDSVNISMNVNVVEAVSCLDNYVYVSLMDGTVISYDMKTGEELKRYTDLEIVVKNAESMNGYTILHNNFYAYILNEDREIVGRMEDYAGFYEENDSFYLTSSYNVYSVPRYSLEMLYEEVE